MSSFGWLRDVYGPNASVDGPGFEEDRKAAVSGAEFALANIMDHNETVAAQIVIDRIHLLYVDTRPSDITYATCLAVWQALRVQGRVLPNSPVD